jgi:hypothetical protein
MFSSRLMLPIVLVLILSLLGCSGDEQSTEPNPVIPSPPATVTDLTMIAADPEDVTLVWTAPADPDGGGAAAYELRYTSMAKSDWNDWTIVQDLPSPAAPGATDTLTIDGLDQADDFVFRLRSADATGHWSGLSNAVAGSLRPMPQRVWRVNVAGTGDAPTIAAAIDSAGPGDRISVGPGRYTWYNQGGGNDYGMLYFPVGYQDVELRSEQGPAVTILDAESMGRVFFIQAHNDGLVIDGFTITGGRATDSGYWCGGGICAHLTTPIIRNCVITGNVARYLGPPGGFGGQGGGVWCGGVSNLRLEACVISDNLAEWGGGVCLVNSYNTSYISHCTIIDNESNDGGGGIAIGHATVMAEDCLIVRNTTGGSGGGMYCYLSHPSWITGSTIADNYAEVSGGGIALKGSSSLWVDKCIVAFAERGGGLVATEDDTLRVGCSNLYGNVGGDGLPEVSHNLGNIFEADPRFRDRVGVDYGLDDDSPCGPGNWTGCGVIGAYTTTSVPGPTGR